MIEYTINTGRHGAVDFSKRAPSKAHALLSFREYIADCKRFGDYYTNASLCIDDELTHVIGPRGGIKRV
jgi:hypothetical protein